MAEGASVPALGLSNKAVFTGGAAGCGHVTEDSHKNDQYSESYFTPQHLTGYTRCSVFCLRSEY